MRGVFVSQWTTELKLAHLRDELTAIWRAKEQRAGERRMADQEAWQALVGLDDDGEAPRRDGNRSSIHAACFGWLRFCGVVAHRLLQRRDR